MKSNKLISFLRFCLCWEAGRVVVPRRGIETFISTIGQLDGWIDLYKGENLAREIYGEIEIGTSALMDLSIMASKLAYENAHVVNNVIVHFWKVIYHS